MSFARRLSNLCAAIAQAAIPALGYLGLLGHTTGSEIQSVKTPVVPADYTFIIWGFIFLFSLIYALDQMRPAGANCQLNRRIGWLTVTAFTANAVWSVVAQLEISLTLTGIIFLVTFVAMMPAVVVVARSADAPKVTRIAIGALAGWVTVAIFANWSVILSTTGIAGAIGGTPLSLAFLGGAGLVAAAVIVLTQGDAIYALTIGWAFSGLIVGNAQRHNVIAAVTSGAVLLVLGGLAILRRLSRGKSRERYGDPQSTLHTYPPKMGY